MKINDKAKKLFSESIVFFATCINDQPNITITQSGVILSEDEILICDCEMNQAKINITANPKCSLITYNEKNEIGYKAIGKGRYYDSGRYLKIAKERLKDEPYHPKGAIVIKLKELIEIK